jgi:hypothetical protein
VCALLRVEAQTDLLQQVGKALSKLIAKKTTDLP